jgi:MFS-type transporter involved in bile tolerance (Atg22 family)
MPVEDPTETRGAHRRTRWAWYAYDFGNTSVEFAIPYYLTPWMVNDLGVPAVVFGLASAASSWAIGLSGPYIGVNADEKHRRRRWFVISALVAAVLLACLNILPRTTTFAVAGVLVVAMVANYFFQLSSLIYNASMLSAAGEANVVSVSSLGMGLSFLGGVVGVGVIQLFISGKVIPGVTGQGYALIPAAAVFFACTIPSIFADKLWQKNSDTVAIPQGRLHHRMKELWHEASEGYHAGWFLGGYFALNSAIMGLTLYLALHIQAVTDLRGMRLWGVLLGVVLSSAAGAGVVALLRPERRMVKRIILVGLTFWAGNAFAFSLVSALPLVVTCACLHGLFSGALVPTVRGAFAQTFPSDYQALAFGLFGAVQRVSQGLGAALWPLAGTAAGGSRGTAAGIAAMGVLALIGVPLFARWRVGDRSTPPEYEPLEIAFDAGTLQPAAAQPATGRHEGFVVEAIAPRDQGPPPTPPPSPGRR